MATPSGFFQIAYVSAASRDTDADVLTTILTAARRNNRRDGITGLLLFGNWLFFQILEGERSVVAECFSRVERDDRHSGITLLREAEVARRAFSGWTMGYGGPEHAGIAVAHPLLRLGRHGTAEDGVGGTIASAWQLARDFYSELSQPSVR
jgi:hypothetical protein